MKTIQIIKMIVDTHLSSSVLVKTLNCGHECYVSSLTFSVTGRRRYALISNSAGFSAPVHAFVIPRCLLIECVQILDNLFQVCSRHAL